MVLLRNPHFATNDIDNYFARRRKNMDLGCEVVHKLGCRLDCKNRPWQKILEAVRPECSYYPQSSDKIAGLK